MKKYKIKTLTLLATAGVLSLSGLLTMSAINTANAANMTRTMVRFARMKTSTTTTGTVCANPTSTATEADVQVTFPTGYTLGVAGTFTVSSAADTSWPSGAVGWSGIATATNVTGQVVTFPSGDLTVGTLYCFNWTNASAVTTSATASANNSGTVRTRTGAAATIDLGGYSSATIADDQIVVTAVVPPTFSFALSGNTDDLGTLSTSSVTTSPTPRTVTVNTNSNNGWQVWAKDSNTGLNSASLSQTIASTTPGTNSTLVAGTAGYNTGITSTQVGGSGTITVAAAFVGTAAGQGGGLDTTFRSLASSNGSANTAVLTMKNNAAISTLTGAATDYTDTITVIGAGLF